jgi:DNA mismatch repair ATPase MutS
MDCIVDVNNDVGEDNKDGLLKGEEVTFLYRLCDGSSPKSYGINVARLAQLPAEVISMAVRQSTEFEQKMKGNANHDESKSGVDQLSQDCAITFFDRLISVAGSELNPEELICVASELWRRYMHIRGV